MSYYTKLFLLQSELGQIRQWVFEALLGVFVIPPPVFTVANLSTVCLPIKNPPLLGTQFSALVAQLALLLGWVSLRSLSNLLVGGVPRQANLRELF